MERGRRPLAALATFEAPAQPAIRMTSSCYLSLPLDALSAAFSPVAFRAW